MTSRRLTILATLLVAGGCATGGGKLHDGPRMSSPQRPSLEVHAVGIAENLLAKVEPGRLAGLRIAVTEIVPMEGEPGQLENALLEYLQNALKSEGARVIERTRLEEALTELRLSASDLFDAQASARAGKLLGLDALLTGSTYREGDGTVRLYLRLVEVKTGEVLAADSYTIPLSDDIRRLTGRNVPGAIRINAPSGTRVIIDRDVHYLETFGEEFEVPSGKRSVSATLDGLSGGTNVEVGERETVTVTPERVPNRKKTWRVVKWNLLIPGYTWNETASYWVTPPALAFYLAVGVTISDYRNEEHGFLTASQQAEYDRAKAANMRYDYGAVAGFYALTVAGAFLQGRDHAKNQGTVRWSLGPLSVHDTPGLVVSYAH